MHGIVSKTSSTQNEASNFGTKTCNNLITLLLANICDHTHKTDSHYLLVSAYRDSQFLKSTTLAFCKAEQ